MSAEATPITPSAFAAALRDLPISTLHLKALELRNSIAHLDYSNEQLKPFADGTDPSLTQNNTRPAAPDQDCIDAIEENEVVIARMQERIGLLKAEVERRGGAWTEFLSAEELEKKDEGQTPTVNGTVDGAEERSEAWRDGTFSTGRIVNGEVRMDGVAGHVNGNGNSSGSAPQTNGTGGRIGDAELRRRLEEQMRNLGTEDEDEGMHL